MAKYPKSIQNDVIFRHTEIENLLMNCPNGFSTCISTRYIKGEADYKIRQILHYLVDVGILSKKVTGLNSLYWQTTELHTAFVRYMLAGEGGRHIMNFIDSLSTPTKQ